MRLIPPQHVKPFARRGKNNRNDAEAVCTAASPEREAFAADTAVIRHAKPGKRSARLLFLLARKLRKSAAAAWAMMASGHACRQPAGA